MPLSAPAPRAHIHTRAISFTGFEREDGLFDIEAHMTDTKSYTFGNDWRGQINPGEALHEMLVRVTVDAQFVVQQVEASQRIVRFRCVRILRPIMLRWSV
tara:strand:- start:129 stop:428 length:300 start_codon:yes stop_codon:yes gene_type:complete